MFQLFVFANKTKFVLLETSALKHLKTDQKKFICRNLSCFKKYCVSILKLLFIKALFDFISTRCSIEMLLYLLDVCFKGIFVVTYVGHVSSGARNLNCVQRPHKF